MLRNETPKEVKCRLEAANKFSAVGHRFYDGLLNVKNGWGWGCINDDGEQVIPCRYNGQILFDETGYARVNQGRHRYGLVDKAGFEWIPCEYDNAEGFDDDGYAKFEKGCYWGTADKVGKVHIQPKMKFQQIGPFTDGTAIAKIETKWGLIDPEGQFDFLWSRYVGESAIFTPAARTPFIHLDYEPFWKLCENVPRQPLRAQLSNELFGLLRDENNRAYFRRLLVSLI